MKILFNSLEEYIVMMICATGELNLEQCLTSQLIKNHNKDNGLYTEDYFKKIVAKLIDEKVIRKYKSKDKKTYLRLCYPKGEERALIFSPELFYHYELLAGKGTTVRNNPDGTQVEIHGNRFSGDGRKEQRRQQTSQVIFKLDECEIKNDALYFRFYETSKRAVKTQNEFTSQVGLVKPETIFNEEGKLLKIKEYMTRLDFDAVNFIVNKALVNPDNESQQRRAGLSKALGLIFYKGNALMTYYLNKNFTWYVNCEKNMKTEYHALVPFNSKNKNPNGVFFIDNIGELLLKLNVKKSKNSEGQTVKGTCIPSEVYQDGAYILPINENIEPILDILLSEGGERGFDYELFGGEELIMYDGNDITASHNSDSNIKTVYYNLSLLNFERLKNAKKQFQKNKNIAITVTSWQKGTVMNYIGMTEENNAAQIITIDEELLSYAAKVSGKEYL